MAAVDQNGVGIVARGTVQRLNFNLVSYNLDTVADDSALSGVLCTIGLLRAVTQTYLRLCAPPNTVGGIGIIILQRIMAISIVDDYRKCRGRWTYGYQLLLTALCHQPCWSDTGCCGRGWQTGLCCKANRLLLLVAANQGSLLSIDWPVASGRIVSFLSVVYTSPCIGLAKFPACN